MRIVHEIVSELFDCARDAESDIGHKYAEKLQITTITTSTILWTVKYSST